LSWLIIIKGESLW